MDYIKELIRKLTNAIRDKKIDTIKYLLKQFKEETERFSVNVRNDVSFDNGATLLHLAVWTDDIKIVDLLLDFQPSALSVRDKEGNTPLHLAVLKKNIDIVKLLLAKNESLISVRNQLKNTVLHLAIIENDIPMITLLLERASHLDIDKKKLLFDAPNNNGFSALHLAVKHKLTEVVDSILKQAPQLVDHYTVMVGKTPLELALREKSLELVQTILKYNPNINAVYAQGNTPLHVAVWTDDIKIVKLLLDFNPSALSIDNDKGNTPLHLAVLKKNIDIVTLLLNKNNELIDVQNRLGNTVLHLAIIENDIPMINLLLDRVSNLDQNKQSFCFGALNNEGFSALHLAVAHKLTEVVDSILKQAPALVDQQTTKGLTPLHIAVRAESLELVQTILNYNPDINAVNTRGNTPLHLAMEMNNKDIIEELLEHGASVGGPKNKEGKAPIDLCKDPTIKAVFGGATTSNVVPGPRIRKRKTPIPLEMYFGTEMNDKKQNHESFGAYFMDFPVDTETSDADMEKLLLKLMEENQRVKTSGKCHKCGKMKHYIYHN